MAQMFGTQGHLEALLEAVTSALASAEAVLERLQTFPRDAEAIQQSHQHMHVIGRAASLMEWPQLAELAHGTEGILADIMDGLTQLDPPILSHIQSSLQTMKLLLQCLQRPDRPPTWPPTLQGMGSVVVAVPNQQWSEEHGRAGEQASRDSYEESDASEQFKKGARREEPSRRIPPPIEIQPAKKTIPRSLMVIVKLQQQRHTGLLFLKRGSTISAEEGWIRFKEGWIVEAEVGRYKGPEARNRLSTWGTCRFIFYPDAQLP